MTTADGTRPFAALLRGYRTAAGLSQEELAARAGLSRRGISDLERGTRRTPYTETVRRLAEALDLDDQARAELHAAVRRALTPNGHMEHGSDRAPSAPVLPLPLTSFVGREREVHAIRHSLLSTRLLTLVGAGGVGKTRLALEVARELVPNYPDGVWLVDFAPLAESTLVAQAVASVLGVFEQPGVALPDTLAEALRQRQLLLVLDNCEHLVQACAELTHVLLQASPSLQVLATSREALGVPGEAVWPVPPLDLPPARIGPSIEGLRLGAAVQLFIERARSVAPDFDLTPDNAATVAEVCSRLDGLPLAIELAAARVRVLAPTQIAARLDDRFRLLVAGSRTAPRRQQTLRATLDWSFDLLTVSEQLLFTRLAVFSGGWTLEAAEAVGAGEGIAAQEVLDLLAALVAKSLVLAVAGANGAIRYRLLETLRQYAQERLAESHNTKAVWDAHATYFLTVAEAAAPHLFGPHDEHYLACLNQLELEQDNLRAALRWLIAQREVRRAQRLGGALRYFWFFQGYLSEGRAWLDELAELPGAAISTVERASVLSGCAILAVQHGDYQTTRTRARQAEALWRELGNDVERGLALFNLASVAGIYGDRLEARALHEEALRLTRAHRKRTVGLQTVEALNLYGLSDLAFGEGAFADARARAQEALAVVRELGWTSPRNSPQIIGMLGDICMEEGDLSAACAYFEDSLAKARTIGWGWGVSLALVRVAHAAIERRDLARARAVLVEAFETHRAQGNRAGTIACLEGVAHLDARRGRAKPALRFASAAAMLREAIHTPASPTERRRLERWLDSAKEALGERASDLVLAQAQMAQVEQIIGEAEAALDTPASTMAPPIGRASAFGATVPLTRREHGVVVLVAQGLTNLQIAEVLVLSERTVESHVRNALSKLELTSRVSLARWAVEQQFRGSSPAP